MKKEVDEIYINLEMDKSIVRNHLLDHIKHNKEFKKTNLFLNFVSSFSRNLLIYFSLIIISLYLAFYNTDLMSNFRYFNMAQLFIFFIYSYLMVASLIILIREIFLFLMKLKYGENFEKGLILTNKDVISLAEKLNKLNKDAESECLSLLNKRNNRNNIIYGIFTEGNNKNIIEKLVSLEIKIKILKEIENKSKN